MKEAGLDHWLSPNTGATNESGFTAFPSGCRNYGNGGYNDIGSYGYFWSSSESYSDDAWYRRLYYNSTYLYRPDYYERSGFSVRCVRN